LTEVLVWKGNSTFRIVVFGGKNKIVFSLAEISTRGVQQS